MNDYDDLPQQNPDPYQTNLTGRMINVIVTATRRIGHWIFLPFHFVGYLLGYAGSMLVRFIEYWTRSLVGRLAQVLWRFTELIQLGRLQRNVESVQQTAINAAIQSVGRVTHTVRERTTDSTWMHRLISAGRAIPLFVNMIWVRFMAWAEQSWLTRVITAPLRGLVWAAYTVLDFVMVWLWTREYRHLLFGIPAILLIMPLAYCAVRLPFYTVSAKAVHYRSAVDEALKADDHETAELYFRKLAQLGDTHERVIMRRALLADEQDRTDDAYRQMQEIAPVDETGLPAAHLWIARAIADNKIETDNPAAKDLIETHLRHARSRLSDEPELDVWLARIHFSNQRYEKCLELLRRTRFDDLDRSARISSADMLAQLEQYHLANAAIKGIAEHYRHEYEVGAEMTVDDFLGWTVAIQIEGANDEALNIVFRGLEKHPDSSRLKSAAESIGIPLFDRYAGSLERNDDRCFEILDKLLDLFPDHIELQRRAAAFSIASSATDRATELLEQIRVSEQLPAHVEKTLGDVAVIKNRLTEARQHYERAADQDPSLHGAMNNLAYLLAHEEPRDVPRALELADAAVRLQPENPNYLETRGQILIQLKQWQRAVDDLEVALNGMPHKREIHVSLATALHELGDHATAEIHEAQAAR